MRAFLFLVVVPMTAVVVAACSSKSSDGGGGSGGTTATNYDGGGGGGLSVPDDGTAGAKAINSRNCGNCHNEEGQPPLSGRTTPLPPLPDQPADVKLYPPNLTPDPDTGLGKWTDGQIKLAIQQGVDNEGLSLCPQMKHYTTMSDDEANAIVAYLKGMQPVKKEIPGSICPPLKG